MWQDDQRSSYRPNTLQRNEYIAVVRQHQATVIQTVRETKEVLQRLKFDRVADVAVSQQRQTAEDPMFKRTQTRICKNTIAHDTQMVIRCWRKSCVLVKGTIRTDQPVVDGMQPWSAQQTSSSVVVKPGGAMSHRSGNHECRLRCGRQ